MFDRFSTENLFLIELSTIKNIIQVNVCQERYTFNNENKRYTLAKKIKWSSFSKDIKYQDIFTKTCYYNIDNSICKINIGDEAVTNTRAVISEKKYLTKQEAIYILKYLNPTYLSKENKQVNGDKVKKKIPFKK